jgi:hypothetical protein
MPERREGINQQRAEELETLLDRQFKIAGLGKPEAYKGLTAVQILEANMLRFPSDTLTGALDTYLQARAVHSQMRVQIAMICGELFGAGDLSVIKSNLDRNDAYLIKARAVPD